MGGQAEAKRVAAEIAATDGKAVVAIGDLSSDAGADAIAKVVNDAVGGIDILVNNAGAYPRSPWLEARRRLDNRLRPECRLDGAR